MAFFFKKFFGVPFLLDELILDDIYIRFYSQKIVHFRYCQEILSKNNPRG